MVREVFPAMGTTVEVLIDATDGPAARGAVDAARREFERLEHLLSRFRPSSELSALNRARSAVVGPDLMRVLRTSLRMRRRTAGLFDPTMGHAIAAAGYDRTLADVPPADPRPLPSAGPAGGTVAVDVRGGRVALADGVALDLGAVAKGDAADRACVLAATAGPCLVNAGGDLVVSGPRADGGPWTVALEGAPALDLTRGALATSGIDRRRWLRAGAPAHHALSPATGLPAATDLVRASAVAPTCAEADALATALLVAGHDRAHDLADAWRVPAALVGGDGSLTLTGGLG